MRCFFTYTIAVVLAIGIPATSWSQTGGGASGAGGGGGGAATGGAGAASGQAGKAGNAGAGANAVNTGGLGGGAAGRAVGGNTVGNNGQVQPGTNGKQAPTANGNRAGTTGNRNARVNGQGQNGATSNLNGRRSANALNANNANNGQAVLQNQSINQTPFFADQGARQQLNLNGTQFNSLNQAYQNAYTRYQTGLNKLNAANLSTQQRDMQQQQLETQFNQDLSGTINSTFNDPRTLSRYNQLNRQYQGFNAFNDPSVRKQLNLSQDQIRQFRTLSGNWRQQLEKFRQNGQSTTNPASWQQLQEQYATQLNGVLTPEQQQMWAQQTGQAYSFSPNLYFNGQQSVTSDPNVPQQQNPSTDPNLPGRLTPNTDPNRPGRLTPSTDPNLPARLTPSTDPNLPARLSPSTDPNLPGQLSPSTDPNVPR